MKIFLKKLLIFSFIGNFSFFSLSAQNGFDAKLKLSIHVNHRGSALAFYQTIVGVVTLVNFDAHSDVNLHNLSLEQPEDAKCDNWISYLAPDHINEVYWIRNYSILTPLSSLEQILLKQWHSKYPQIPVFTSSYVGFSDQLVSLKKIAVSIDLDMFVSSKDPIADLNFILDIVLGHPGLVSLTAAVSRPWLPDDKFAFSLLEVLIHRCHDSGRFGKIVFNLGRDSEHKDTLKAAEYKSKGLSVPEFSLSKAPEDFIKFLEKEVILVTD